jgi:hypothetical protein
MERAGPAGRTRLSLRRPLAISLTLALAAAAAIAAPTPALDLPPGCWGPDRTGPILAKTLEVRLAPDLSSLSEGERAALANLVLVGHVMENLYELQNHRGAPVAQHLVASLVHTRGAPAKPLADLYRLFQGPIATTLDNDRRPFLPVDTLVPGKNLYPWGVSKAEIERYLADHLSERAAILAPRTVVMRARSAELRSAVASLRKYDMLRTLFPGLDARLSDRVTGENARGFCAVPYAVAYADSLVRASELLQQAAKQVKPSDAEFADYLEHRAVDLLSNDYEGGDASWVTGTYRRLNAQIGAYETYDDELFGVKAFHSLSLMLEDQAQSQALAGAIKSLQAFEDSLPYTPHKRVRDRVPVGIYDVIADFGQARGTNTATILPNESAIVRRYGRTILIRRNILMDPRLLASAGETWNAAVDPQHKGDPQADGNFYRTLWHEIGHYLGPDRDRRGRELDLALEEESGTFEEMKADLVSLFLARSLGTSGYYDTRKLRGVYASGIARVLLKSRPRPDQVYGVMQLMQMNWFLEHGVLEFDPETKKLRIHYERYHEAVASLLREVIGVQLAGDKAAADRFIARWTAWDGRHEALAAAMRAAETSRYRLVRYGVFGE